MSEGLSTANYAEAEAERLGGLLRIEQQRVFAVEAERDKLGTEVLRLREQQGILMGEIQTQAKAREAANKWYIEEAVYSNELSNKLEIAEAERDRYREALEKVRKIVEPLDGSEGAKLDEIYAILTQTPKG
jgi:hypothetical protein